jgi:uncharacterized protein YndB with AHSA1/START domain
MTHSIKHLFHIDAKRSDVFKAISTIDGLSNWWTVTVLGDSSLNNVIQFRFGEHGGPDMQVISVKHNESITWKCLASPHGWVGHTFTFSLDENDGKTRVRFSHNGWEDNDDYYAICTFSWGRYMESLRQLCQTGQGQAFGSTAYVK